jgi:DNA-binding FrmR family transcriptional regulator
MNNNMKGGKNMEDNKSEINIEEVAKEVCDNCRLKEKERDTKEYKDLISRLNRIEGQVRGIKGMVEKGSYCPDILIQVAAANAALNSFSRVLLSNHIKTCVTDDIRAGKEETVDELIATLQKMLK